MGGNGAWGAIFPDTALGRWLTERLERVEARRWFMRLVVNWLPFAVTAAAAGIVIGLQTDLAGGIQVGVGVAVAWLIAFGLRDARPPAWIVAGTLTAAIGFVARDADHQVDGRSLDLQFAATADRLQEILDRFHPPLTTSDFTWDFVLIGLYVLGGLALCARVWRRSNSALSRRWGIAAVLVLAGAADIAENLVTVNAGRVDGAAQIVFWLAALKWSLLGVVTWSFVHRVLSGRARAGRESAPIFDRPPRVWVGREQRATHQGTGVARRSKSSLAGQTSDEEHVGICCSGGGIRSAAFCLGALHGLGHERVRSAKHLAAVSGGSYIATAMSALFWAQPEQYRNKLPFGEGSKELGALRAHSRYLFADGTGGRTTIIRAFVGTVVNVAMLWLVLFAVLRPVGWLASSDPVHPELRATGIALGSVELDDDIEIDDLVLTPTTDWPTGCATGEAAHTYTVTFADGRQPQVEADVMDDVQTGGVHSATFEPDRIEPGIVEVCDTTATIVRQPHLVFDEPLVVERQPKLELDDDRPLAIADPDGAAIACDDTDEPAPDAPVAALCERLDIATQPGFGHETGLHGRDDISIETWMWAVPLALLLLAAIATAFGKDLTAGKGRPTLRIPVSARLLGGSALLVLAVGVVVPLLIQEVPRLLESTLVEAATPDSNATGAAAWLAIFSAAYTAARKASSYVSTVQVKLRRLGLVGLKIVAALTSAVIISGMAFGIVRYAAVTGPRGRLAGIGANWWSPERIFAAPDVLRWFVVVGLLLLLALLVDVHSWSLQPVYRDRLATAFFPERDDRRVANLGRRARDRNRGDVDPDRRWPILTVCATANLNDPASLACTSAGRYGQSFIFSEDVIGWPHNYIGTADYADRVRGRNERLLDLDSIVAVSGAAFSPAMGKFGFGPIGGLMAILNLRLGMWVPNPRHVARAEAQSWRNVPGWPYLLREVFGRYDAERPHLYVTDGGHWENLGLVELLRRGCNEIYVISAAGDGRHSFATIGEAVALAREVADIDITVELTPLRPPVGGTDTGHRQLLDESGDDPERLRFALEPYAIGSFEYPRANQDGKGRGVILFVESALTADVPWDVQAWAEKNPSFPNDPTTDQFFDYGQFEAYRRLGEHQMTIASRSNAWNSARRWRRSEEGAKRPTWPVPPPTPPTPPAPTPTAPPALPEEPSPPPTEPPANQSGADARGHGPWSSRPGW